MSSNRLHLFLQLLSLLALTRLFCARPVVLIDSEDNKTAEIKETSKPVRVTPDSTTDPKEPPKGKICLANS